MPNDDLTVEDCIETSLQVKRTLALVGWIAFSIVTFPVGLIFVVWKVLPGLANIDRKGSGYFYKLNWLSYWQALGLSSVQVENLDKYHNRLRVNDPYTSQLPDPNKRVFLVILQKSHSVPTNHIDVLIQIAKVLKLNTKINLSDPEKAIWSFAKGEDDLQKLQYFPILINLNLHNLSEGNIASIKSFMEHARRERLPVILNWKMTSNGGGKATICFFKDISYVKKMLDLPTPHYNALQNLITKAFKDSVEEVVAYYQASYFEPLFSQLLEDSQKVKTLTTALQENTQASVLLLGQIEKMRLDPPLTFEALVEALKPPSQNAASGSPLSSSSSFSYSGDKAKDKRETKEKEEESLSNSH